MEYKGLNSVEYEYEKRVEGDYALKRKLYIVAAVVISLAIMVAVCLVGGPFVYTVPVIFIICLIVFGNLYKFFQISYKYTIEGGIFTVYTVYNGTKKKEYYRADLRKATSIMPYNSEDASEGKVYCSCISLKNPSPELYVIKFTDENGKPATAYFEATKNTLKVMKYFYRDTVIADCLRH